jgi:hypothetical protein
MMQKSLILAAAAATLAAFVTVPSNAEARAYHRMYGQFDGYGYAPSYAPRYRYGWRYRYYDRLGSNLNPDRQMVGQGG